MVVHRTNGYKEINLAVTDNCPLYNQLSLHARYSAPDKFDLECEKVLTILVWLLCISLY